MGLTTTPLAGERDKPDSASYPCEGLTTDPQHRATISDLRSTVTVYCRSRSRLWRKEGGVEPPRLALAGFQDQYRHLSACPSMLACF